MPVCSACRLPTNGLSGVVDEILPANEPLAESGHQWNGESAEPSRLLDSGQWPKDFQHCVPGAQVMQPIPHQEVKLRSRPHPVSFTDCGVFVFESRHDEAFSMDLGRSNYHKLALIRLGGGALETAKSRIPLKHGQLIYLPPGMPHRFEDQKGNPLTLIMFCFYEKLFLGNDYTSRVLSRFKSEFPCAYPFDLTDNYRRVGVVDKFKQAILEQTQRREEFETLMWSQLLQLLILLTRAYEEFVELASTDLRESAFAGSLSYLNNHFYDPISIKDLAKLANMSYRSFTEHFRKQTGKTVTQYLSQIRVEYAKQKMLETENILYSAFESGFGDLSHFYRVFKKTTGTTPKQYLASQMLSR